MGQWKYRKLESTDIQGTCVIRLVNLQKKVAGKPKYRPICSSCDNKLRRSSEGKIKDKETVAAYKRPYRKFVKSFCEECGLS